MNFLTVARVIAAIVAIAYMACQLLHAWRRHHNRLHTQSHREVADNCRPHGADITIAPAHAPRSLYDQETELK